MTVTTEQILRDGPGLRVSGIWFGIRHHRLSILDAFFTGCFNGSFPDPELPPPLFSKTVVITFTYSCEEDAVINLLLPLLLSLARAIPDLPSPPHPHSICLAFCGMNPHIRSRIWPLIIPTQPYIQVHSTNSSSVDSYASPVTSLPQSLPMPPQTVIPLDIRSKHISPLLKKHPGPCPLPIQSLPGSFPDHLFRMAPPTAFLILLPWFPNTYPT